MLNLTAEQLRSLLSYDPETGEFRWLTTRRGAPAGKLAGCHVHVRENLVYRRIRIFDRPYKAHRLAWLHFYGEWPPSVLDHVNGDGCDNRIANLRLASVSLNAANTKLRRTNTTGMKGVYWHPKAGKWVATIKANGRKRHLGLYADKSAAGEAYRIAAVEAFGEFANTGITSPPANAGDAA